MSDSFLPPHFGFLDWPKVRVVDHVVLAGLCCRNHCAERKHGVLFVGSWVVLSEARGNKWDTVHLEHHIDRSNDILGNVLNPLSYREKIDIAAMFVGVA